MKNKLYLLIGGDGSGRTTVAQLLQDVDLGRHLTTGGVLRKRAEKDDSLAKTMADGLPVDSAFVMSIVADELNAQSGTILLDGMPNSMAQLTSLLEVTQGKFDVVAIYLRAALDVRTARCKSRVTGADGKVYNLISNHPPAGITYTTRSDDTEEALAKKEARFVEDMGEVIEELKKGPFYTLDANGDINAIYKAMKGVLLGA